MGIWEMIGSTIASLMFTYAMFQQYFPYYLYAPIQNYIQKSIKFLNPYVQITFPEYQPYTFSRSVAFSAIQRYLDTNSTRQAKHLQANILDNSDSIILTMGNDEEVIDDYQGIKLWWKSKHYTNNNRLYARDDEKREFVLTFHDRYRDIITGYYLQHVIKEGKAIAMRQRRRKLYTNNSSGDGTWSHVLYQHSATFQTLAMDPVRKQDIVKDLLYFTDSEDYYAKIGKAWKRGYLLYGPPGTGKSTMIAAMSNLLNYDIYDIELTAVKNNTELRKLLIDTSRKSMLVIEDIDCSLDLTGQRKQKDEDKDGKLDPIKKEDDDKEKKTSKVTLSGLLNFIDGVWSACGGERIIVFTTNHIEKLDPALIRRGRMDRHIELPYCDFETFKLLAKNYLDIDSHHLFVTIRQLLVETSITPADVAENLMLKYRDDDKEICLKRLIRALEEAKVKAE